jgi:vitamin B12 transporter
MTCFRRSSPALLALALALGPATRAADQASAPADEARDPLPAEPPPAVPGAASPEPVEEIVVRGVRRPQSDAALAPGAAVTVVDAARYAGEAKGAAELLATAPGVAVTQHGGPGQAASVSIRGSGADHVKVLLDGLPLNTAAGGGVDLSSIPAPWISRVEVVRGADGVHHGSGALGGIVNVVTPAVSGTRGSASATAGSFDSYLADLQGAAGGPGWGLLAAASAASTSGRFEFLHDRLTETNTDPLEVRTRTNGASRLAGGLVKGFVLAAGGRLDALVQLTGGDRDLPGDPYDPTLGDWQRDARGLAALRFRTGGERLSTSVSAWTRLDRLDASLEDVGDEPTRQRGLAGAASLGAEWRHPALAISGELEAGGERLDANALGEHSRGVFAATLAAETTALSGRLRAGPGVRLERAGAHAGVSAKLGGQLALAGPVSLRASAGRTYRVPSFAELYLQQGVVAPNPALRPEVGLGGDGALVVDGRLGTASVGAFATSYRDLVVYQAVSFRRLAPVNAARTIVRGVEVEASGAPMPRLAGLSGGLAYTFTDSENLRGPPTVVGRDVTRRPRHRLYARVGVGGPAADAHAELQWVSRHFLDLANRRTIPESLSLGAGGSVRLLAAPDLRLNLEVRNVLDDRSLQDGFGYPLPGRTVLVTLRAVIPPHPR